jgi:hypothetical protein
MEKSVVEPVRFTKDVAFNCLGQPEYFDKYRNLRFTNSGFARLWYTVGYFQSALEVGDERGRTCLVDLENYLEKLNSYGGQISDENRNPAYRVVLGDDGCWGSFSLKWYRAITVKQFYEYRKEKNCIYDQAIEWLRINDDLKLWNSGGYDQYGYAFNGGLIFHWKDDVLDGSYSTHT